MSRQPILALGLVALALALGPWARPAHAAEPSGTTAAVGHPAHGHAAPEGEPNILELQPNLAIWTLVVFIVLLLVLSKFALKPLAKALHQREEHLEHCLLDTERARNESEQLLAEHRRQMAEAADQVRALIEGARRDAQAVTDDMLQKARAEADAERQRARREIESARDQALMEIWTKTADLAVSVAGRVLARELNESDQRRMVESAIAELPDRPTAVNGHEGQRA